MNRADPTVADALGRLIGEALKEVSHRPVVVGICGAQGSGKSTLASSVVNQCWGKGIKVAALSIDDLYLTKRERQDLAAKVHPLLETRGPPGTHDVPLGLRVIEALRRGEAAALPRFDKASDDRMGRAEWERAPAGCEVLLFEGWCVGAMPQAEGDLSQPVNPLEAEEDPHGVWRRYANDALAGPYRALFDCLDRLVLLAAPSFDVVFKWRMQQERELRATAPEGIAVMDEVAVRRFIQHYERITRYILDEMPERADLLVRLDENRRALEIKASR